MNSTSIDTALKEAGIMVQNDKATQQMQQSISKFASLLACPLCDKIFNRPATLSACGHTFALIASMPIHQTIAHAQWKDVRCPYRLLGAMVDLLGNPIFK